MAFVCPEEFRNRADGVRLYGWVGDETCGVFLVPSHGGRRLHIIASNGEGWEHVSISCWQCRKSRTPTWEEMCRVKSLFWGPEDCVVQYHPPESQYVNQAEALHLWRPTEGEMRTPPSILVGLRDDQLKPPTPDSA